jgi:predicted phosphodiesterase
MRDGPIAIISDLHSNLEAVTAVFREIDRREIREVYCLGDIVGYGPDPGPVIEIVRQRCSMVLRGNHDEALFRGADDFNPIARQALEANRELIRPGFLKPAIRRLWWMYLRDLRESEQQGDFLFVHGSPRDPIREYVMKADVMFSANKLEEIFRLIPRYAFGGHTHQPGVFLEGDGHRTPEEVGGRFSLDATKAFVNVGSVGQPRDGNPLACFVVLDQGTIEWVRVEYDIQQVQDKIRRNRSIDDLCAERLSLGR